MEPSKSKSLIANVVKLVVCLVVVSAAVYIIWRVGFQTPKSSAAKVTGEPDRPGAAEKSSDTSEPEATTEDDIPPDMLAALMEITSESPTDPNERRGPGMRPGGFGEGDERRGPGMRSGGFARGDQRRDFGRRRDSSDADEPNDIGDPNDPLVALNLRNVEMKVLIQKLSEWTDKTVIPSEESEKIKLTVYAPKRLPRSKALAHIYGALSMKGFVAEHIDDAIYIATKKDAKVRFVPTVAAEQPLALLENKEQIVQKFFRLKSYSPAEMGKVVQPLVGEYGHVSADETTGTLLVIDTVGNLIRIERIITEFDVPEAEQTVTKIIPVQFGDPSEIVQMLKILLGESQGYSSRYNRGRDYGRSSSSSSSQRSPERTSSSKKPDSKSGEASSVVVGTTRGPVVLIPEPRRKWIIAKASAEDMKQIEEWISKLDMEEPVASEHEVVQLRYADPGQVEDSIEDGLRDLPGIEFVPSLLVEPVYDTKQVILFGRKDLRDMAKKIIEQIDVQPGQFITEHFKLKYADPDQIKTYLEELYGEDSMQSRSRGYSPFYNPWSRSRSSTPSSDTVKVISYVSQKKVTVIASEDNMEQIRQQIAEWDSPIDPNEVMPKIISLRNTDPVQMAELLSTLFSESGGSSGGRSIIDLILGRSDERQKIVGALYGQLAFEAVPDTKKIIVISNIPEAYNVVSDLIAELDKEEMGEVPKVITLKYADPEELSERLNAVFSEAGTTASIRRSDVGLSEYSMVEETTTGSSDQDTTSQEDYRPPWTTGRSSTDEMPISNVIGRIRFVPDPRTKSILVLAPPEFMENIDKLIEALDIPGKQVMVKAIIMQIDHSNVTSLGLRLQTGEFATSENAISFTNTLSFLQEHGALVFGEQGGGSSLDITAGITVDAMIDFLVKYTEAKILNQQTLWTKDNEEAEFFKGKKAAFLAEGSITAGVQQSQTYTYERVGMTLRVRPSITPENNVDMIINVILSQITAETVSDQAVRTEMDTTTNMIVQHGQTLMLGGILFQTDSKIKRKIPVLGDIPVAGNLFRHNETTESNEELIVFITPFVVDEPNNMLPETIEQIEGPKQKLMDVQEQLNVTMEELKAKS